MYIMLSFVAQLGNAAAPKQAAPRANKVLKGGRRMDTSRRAAWRTNT